MITHDSLVLRMVNAFVWGAGGAKCRERLADKKRGE